MTEPIKHRSFSLGRVNAITWNTLTELIRLKVFYFLLIFALVIIGGSAFMVQFQFREEFQMLKDAALGAMSIFTSLMAIAATALMLPKDVEDRTLYTILAKPVRRFEYLCGKLGGMMLLLAISTILMSVMFFGAMAFRVHMVKMEETATQQAAIAQGGDPVLLTEALRHIDQSAWGGSLIEGIVVIYLKACVIASMTLFVSTFATSTIFTIMVSAAIYFIGHLQPIARDYWMEGKAIDFLTRILFLIISLIFPDFQLFNLVDDIVAGNSIALDLFLKTVGIGGLYVAIYLMLAGIVFWWKEL